MTVWTEEMIKKLKELLMTAKTTREIGAELGVNRNSVAGKTFRLRHGKDDAALVPRRPNEQKRRKPKVAKPPPDAAPAFGAGASDNVTPDVALAPALKSPVPVVLEPDDRCYATTQLTSGQCRWPLWEHDKDRHVYCCAPVVDGRVYCGKHCTIAYNRPYNKGLAA